MRFSDSVSADAAVFGPYVFLSPIRTERKRMNITFEKETKACHRRSMEEPVVRNPEEVTDLGERIREARKKRGLSQEQLADRMAMDRKTVSRYEQGEREMGISTFIQIAEALDMSPSELLPERLTKKPACNGKLEALRILSESLPEDDVDLLISLAMRMLSL